MEKIIPTILGALLPFILTYISKLNKSSIRRNMMEDAQKKIDFINNYFEVSKKFLSDDDLSTLKNQLSNEINEVKNKIIALDRKEEITGYQKLNTVQKVFITFRPLSTFGWIWAILFYIFFILDLFLALGLFVDEHDNFTFNAPLYHFNDPDLVTGLVIFIILLLPPFIKPASETIKSPLFKYATPVG